MSMDGTFQATAGFQDSDVFQKAIKMSLRCILSVNSHLSGFKLKPGPINAFKSSTSIFQSSLAVEWD